MNVYLRYTLFVLVLLGLGAQAYLAGSVLKRRFAIEADLAKSVVDASKAIEAKSKAEVEFTTAKTALASAKLGWGNEWNFPAGGQVGAVQVVAGGNLNVSGLGANTGLRAVDVNGAPSDPAVHVFGFSPQNQPVYLGEFHAPVAQIAATNCVLVPSSSVNLEDINQDAFSRGIRMRAEIPAGPRRSVENLAQNIRRSVEKRDLAIENGRRQQDLNTAALEGLDTRKRELLGDPNGPDVAEYPEYRVGLVKALENLEEERNAVQLSVDQLRRLVKAATETRQQNVESLQQLASRLERSSTRVTQRAE
ncbi:MAG: hypothetical protein JNM43_21685 [Planctomycetaceae bacterium]|nr:hypothetical protein [Planctomycetaceae bacterium]